MGCSRSPGLTDADVRASLGYSSVTTLGGTIPRECLLRRKPGERVGQTQLGDKMTFEELDQRFPNGFVDARITGLSLDYQNRTAKVFLNLRGNPPESPNRDEYRRATLLLNGFYYFVIEAPDADHLWYPQRTIQVNGHAEDDSQFPIFGLVKSKQPGDAFCCRFYVHDWNSFIHIAAKDAQLSWDAGEAKVKSEVSES